MSFIALVRHGPTLWNEEKRIQGRTDISLSTAGEAAVSSWRLPEQFKNWPCFSSPLARTRETAELLGLTVTGIEPALIEADWGDFEGKQLAQLREQLGDSLRDNEARGLDFTPPGGESPRAVGERVSQWMRSHDQAARLIAITHKGVIRSVLAQATGWDMRSKPPVRLKWQHAHVFEIDPTGSITLSHANVPLVQNDPPGERQV